MFQQYYSKKLRSINAIEDDGYIDLYTIFNNYVTEITDYHVCSNNNIGYKHIKSVQLYYPIKF